MSKHQHQPVQIIEVEKLVDRIVYVPKPVYVEKAVPVVVEKPFLVETPVEKSYHSVRLTNFDDCFVDYEDNHQLHGTLLDYDGREFSFDWDRNAGKLISLSGAFETEELETSWSVRWALAERCISDKLIEPNTPAPSKLPPIPESPEVHQHAETVAHSHPHPHLHTNIDRPKSVQRSASADDASQGDISQDGVSVDPRDYGMGTAPSNGRPPDNEDDSEYRALLAEASTGINPNTVDVLNDSQEFAVEDEEDMNPLKVGEMVKTRGEISWTGPSDNPYQIERGGVVGTIEEIDQARGGALLRMSRDSAEWVPLGDLRRLSH